MVKLLLNESSLSIAFRDKVIDFRISWIVILCGRNRSNSFILKGKILHGIGGLHHSLRAKVIKDLSHHTLELFTSLHGVVIWIFFRQDFVEDYAAECSIANFSLSEHADWGLQGNQALIVSHLSFIDGAKGFHLFGGSTWLVISQVVDTEHHVLINRKYWSTVSWFQEVLAGRHQLSSFGLSRIRQRQVHCHLVTIIVSVKARGYERV